MPKSVNPKKVKLHTNKVYQVVTSLNKRDRQKLKDFLKSPYFNKSNTIVDFFDAIVSQIEIEKNLGFEKEAVWKSIFNSRPYNDVLFRKYCSDLLKIIEEFLFSEKSREKGIDFKINLLESLLSRKLETLYSSILSETKENMGTKSSQSSEHYYLMFKLEWLKHRLNASTNLYKNKANFEDISSNLDTFYFIEKLKIASTALSHQQVISANYQIEFIEEIEEHVSRMSLASKPTLSMYYYVHKMISDGNDTISFFSLKALISLHISSLPSNEALDLLVSILNFCTRRVNAGDSSFLTEYFEIVEIGLNNNLFIQDGHIESWRFTNFVFIALRMKKFDWAEKFIENYMAFLKEDDRENMVSFNLARLYYNQKKYSQVLEILRNVEYKDLNYNLNSKMLMITTYFDTDSYEALDSFLESFRVYINRHRDISTHRRKTFLNFIKFVKKLMRLSPGDKKAIEKTKEELIKDKSVTANHEWLMEKIAELEK